MRRHRFGVLAGLAIAMFTAAGCGDGISLTRSVQEIPIFQVDFTDPVKALLAHGEALSQKNHDAYVALLSPDFKFYIRDDDASDLPWVVNGAWPYSVEIEIMANMMDPNFSGNELPVEAIEADFIVRNISEIIGPDSEGYLLLADADMRVLVGPGYGLVRRHAPPVHPLPGRPRLPSDHGDQGSAQGRARTQVG